MHIRLEIRSLLMLVVFAGAFNFVGAAQQSITLRIIDYKTAKPMVKLRVEIEGFNGDLSQGRSSAATVVMRKFAKTDRNGSVVVSIPESLPEHLRVFSFDLLDSITDFSPADVLKYGAVIQYPHATEAEKRNILAKPGEVVILCKRIKGWNRMLQEIP